MRKYVLRALCDPGMGRALREQATAAVIAAAAIRAMVAPPSSCPACDAEVGRQSPAGTTSRHCERHMEELRQQMAARKGTVAA